jgi:eukaryotic-like serine/threonine-protein kinase
MPPALRPAASMRSHEIHPGDVIARKYRVRAILGRAHGLLIDAFHTEFDQRVIVKLLPPGRSDEIEVERFKREARTLAKLESEHVARIIDVGREPDGSFYLVRQFLEGTDLARYLRQNGPLPLRDAVLATLMAAEAVAETHSHGIIVRELQPGHLFLTQRAGGSPLVKITDFGTAKLMRVAAAPTPGEVTATAMFGLSPYSSPELVRKAKNVDARTDVWSLGVIFYELLTGRAPFQGEEAQLMLQITREEPEPASMLRSDLPAEIDAILGWAMAKDLDARFKSVHALAHALGPYTSNEGHLLIERIGQITEAGRTRPRSGSVPPPAPAPAAPPSSPGHALAHAPLPIPLPPPILPGRALPPVRAPGGRPLPPITPPARAAAADDSDETIRTVVLPPVSAPPERPSSLSARPARLPSLSAQPDFLPPLSSRPLGPPKERRGAPPLPVRPGPSSQPFGPPVSRDRRVAGPRPPIHTSPLPLDEVQEAPEGWIEEAPPSPRPSVPAPAPTVPPPVAIAVPPRPVFLGLSGQEWSRRLRRRSGALLAAAAMGVLLLVVLVFVRRGSGRTGPERTEVNVALDGKPWTESSKPAAASPPTPPAPAAAPTVAATATAAVAAPAPTVLLPSDLPAAPTVLLPSDIPMATADPGPASTPRGSNVRVSAPRPAPAPKAEPAEPPEEEPGTLLAIAVGGSCAFIVNGAGKGVSSTLRMPLKPGTYTVMCKPESGASKSKSVVVRSGETAMATFRL